MGRVMSRPLARTQELLVQKMGDETLVYDLERDKAFCLNRTASVVWAGCDGKTTVEELSAALSRELGVAGESVVWLALHQLQKAKLMGAPLELPEGAVSPSRRQALRALKVLGGAAMLLPVVTAALAPTPAYAVTCRTAGMICASTVQCCNGLTCSGGTCQPL